MDEQFDGLHNPLPFISGSGASDDNPHVYEIKKDELYVISGDTLINSYKLLSAQRISALIQINNIPPTYLKEIEIYINLFKRINRTMYDIMNAIQYKKLKEMESGKKQNATPNRIDSSETDFAEFMKDFLKRNKISLDGTMNDDGKKDDTPPSDNIKQ